MQHFLEAVLLEYPLNRGNVQPPPLHGRVCVVLLLLRQPARPVVKDEGKRLGSLLARRVGPSQSLYKPSTLAQIELQETRKLSRVRTRYRFETRSSKVLLLLRQPARPVGREYFFRKDIQKSGTNPSTLNNDYFDSQLLCTRAGD